MADGQLADTAVAEHASSAVTAVECLGPLMVSSCCALCYDAYLHKRSHSMLAVVVTVSQLFGSGAAVHMASLQWKNLPSSLEAVTACAVLAGISCD
jgi:hypothetical protein